MCLRKRHRKRDGDRQMERGLCVKKTEIGGLCVCV